MSLAQGPDLELDAAFLWPGLGSGQFGESGPLELSWKRTLQGAASPSFSPCLCVSFLVLPEDLDGWDSGDSGDVQWTSLHSPQTGHPAADVDGGILLP